MQSKSNSASGIALGGILAAVAMVIMNMGTLIPVATYTCPVLCILILQIVLKSCGRRLAWAWYGAVAVLSLLFAPDKEAAAVFAFLGYYPILKPKLDGSRLQWIWKGFLFNASILILYWLLMHLFGLEQIAAEFEDMGKWMTILLLLLGNLTFFLLDRLLEMQLKRKH